MWRSLSNKFARFLNRRLAFRCSFEMSQCRCRLQTAAFTPTGVHIHAHMHVFTHSCTNTHMCTLMHTNTCAHTCTHTCAHTCTHSPLPPLTQSHSHTQGRPAAPAAELLSQEDLTLLSPPRVCSLNLTNQASLLPPNTRRPGDERQSPDVRGGERGGSCRRPDARCTDHSDPG